MRRAIQTAARGTAAARRRTPAPLAPLATRRKFSTSPSACAEQSTSSSNQQDQQSQQQQQQQKKKAEPEPEDTTVAGRSPFQAFVDVLRDEVRKNREWQESVKQLQGEASKVQDSEAMKRAKEVYERARLTASIKENPRLQAAAEELRRAGITVNEAVSHALKGMEENALIRGGRDAVRPCSLSPCHSSRFLTHILWTKQIYKAGTIVSSAAMSASEPLRQTEAYKAVAAEITEALDDAASNVQHGGYMEKEDRRRRREQRLIKLGKKNSGLAAGRKREKIEENPEAGEAVTLHATANVPKTSRFASITPAPVAEFLSSLSNSYQESENPIVSSLRSVTSTIGRFFDETETAKVTKWVKEMDPSFTTEGFLRDLREYIVPELVDAYVNADQATLKTWCSEATYNVTMATLQPYISPTLLSESRVLDIRNLDIMSTKILENDLHVYVVSWRTQEILAYRDLKTGEITVGNENKIEQVGYVAVITRVEEELENKITGGWKIMDMARRAG